MKLAPAHVDVWLAFDREITATEIEPQVAALLAPDELERAARLRTAELQHQFRVTRILQRTALSAYADVAPADWRFVSGAHGKPELAPPFAARGIHFNVAHSAGLVVLAVARDAAVGVDVENTRARAAPLAVAGRYFSADEARELQALPVPEQTQRFYALWTLKESWLKATGRGLAAGLGNASFVLDARHAAVGVALANDVAARWRFWQAQPSAEHLLALALCSEQGGEFGVRMQRWSHATPLAPAPLAAPRALGASSAAGSGQEQRAQA